MIIFLSGPDAYRRSAARDRILTDLQAGHPSASAVSFDGSEDPVAAGEFLGFIRGQSLFAAPRIAAAANCLADLDARGAAQLKILAEQTKTHIVLTEAALPKGKPWAFLSQPPVRSDHFEFLKGSPWRAFVRSELLARGLHPADAAVELLARTHQNDTWRLATELDKLANLGRKNLTVADLQEMGVEETGDFWQLLTGLHAPALRVRLAALEQMFAQNEPAARLFYIASAKGGEKTPRFAAYDLAIKSGKLDYEEALVDLVMS
ncbi:MAG: hypothetical protein HY978_01280 [Candidatus Liptonbacteria bacterium]|nr:hypothetical protein [Candidatus Liptonbacteria bacterium]